MEIKSVKNSRQPNYPTIELFVRYPELLARNIPGSWLKNKFVATSLAAFLLSNCGTRTVHPSATVEVVDMLKTDNPKSTSQEKKADNSIVAKIAPIFAYGEGHGSTGCIVISPPVFISEDEARKIIFDALDKQGIVLDTIGCPEMKFTAPPLADACYEDGILDDETTQVATKAKVRRKKAVKQANVELKMDGYIKDLNLVIQFVSEKDFDKFNTEDGCRSSVIDYNTKKAAKIIREKLIAYGKTNAVVFYDPIIWINFKTDQDWQTSENIAKAEAERLLLNQVEDFIKWLKTETII